MWVLYMDFYTKQFKLIKESNNIQDASIKTYLGSIKKICRELFNSNTCSLMYFKDHQSVIEYLNEIKSVSTRKNTCTAIIVLLKANNLDFIVNVLPVYSNFQKELAEKQNDFYLDNEKTKKEKDNWVTQKEIYEKINELEKRIERKQTPRMYIDAFQQYLVLNLYTQLPPIRNDFALVKITHEKNIDLEALDKATNYINFKTKTDAEFIMCNYKTAKSYGVKVIPLPDTLTDILYRFQAAKQKVFSREFDYLLINTTNLEPMKKNSLTKYINKIFAPKKVGTTLIRKCYLSEKYPVTFSTREKEKDAYIMGHSTGMASSVYSKK